VQLESADPHLTAVTTFTTITENLNSLSLSSAISRIKAPIEALQKEQAKQQEQHNKFTLLMAKMESESSPRLTDFNADAFDMAADNCASKTCTPYESDL
jgi:hypothetical protein